MDLQQRATLEAANEAAMAPGDWSGKPAIAASAATVTNTSNRTMWVEVTGGTVTLVKVDGVTIGARVAGMFLVRPGSTIALTYSVAPTWQWFALA